MQVALSTRVDVFKKCNRISYWRSEVSQTRLCRQGAQLLASLALIALFCSERTSTASAVQSQPPSIGLSAKASQLSPESQAWLLKSIDTGTSPDLRWPDFSDYSKHLKRIYEFNRYSLWWVHGGEPTVQARQLIELMREADRKGLSAEDYDGARWDDRLAKLKPATRQPAEADAVRFDLALTVCAMRYISDLHIGKVNPKHLDFAFDEESKKVRLGRVYQGPHCRRQRYCRRRGTSRATIPWVPARDSIPANVSGTGEEG